MRASGRIKRDLHNGVDPVDELGRQMGANGSLDELLRFRGDGGAVVGEIVEVGGSQIRRHDHDGVLESWRRRSAREGGRSTATKGLTLKLTMRPAESVRRPSSRTLIKHKH